MTYWSDIEEKDIHGVSSEEKDIRDVSSEDRLAYVLYNPRG
jgi:hypothetical protein